KLELWDVRTREKRLTISLTEEQSINDACFSPDGTRLAGVVEDGGIFLWESVNGKILQRFGEGGKGQASTGCFRPDGEVIITSRGYGAGYLAGRSVPVSFWDTQTGKLIRRHHFDPGPCWSFCLSPDGKHLAGGDSGDRGNLRIWRADNGELEHTLIGHEGHI